MNDLPLVVLGFHIGGWLAGLERDLVFGVGVEKVEGARRQPGGGNRRHWRLRRTITSKYRVKISRIIS